MGLACCLHFMREVVLCSGYSRGSGFCSCCQHWFAVWPWAIHLISVPPSLSWWARFVYHAHHHGTRAPSHLCKWLWGSQIKRPYKDKISMFVMDLQLAVPWGERGSLLIFSHPSLSSSIWRRLSPTESRIVIKWGWSAEALNKRNGPVIVPKPTLWCWVSVL